MSVKQVDRLEAFATDFGIEVDSTWREATLLQDHQHALCGEVDVGRKLIRIPAKHHVTRVGVDAAESSLHRRILQLVHHRVPSQCRVICLNIELADVLKTVAADEVHAGGRIEVVLVLRRLFRFWFEQELSFEADRLRVIFRQMKEASHVIQLALHVRIKEVVVSLAATPEDVVDSTELMRDFNRLFHLSGGKRKDVRIAGCRGTVHEPRIGKQIRGSPQKIDPGALLLGLQLGGDSVKVRIGF